MEEKQLIFNEFMNEFIKLDISQKNNEIIEKEKTLLAMLIKYATERGLQFEFLKSREINDINDNKGNT